MNRMPRAHGLHAGAGLLVTGERIYIWRNNSKKIGNVLEFGPLIRN